MFIKLILLLDHQRQGNGDIFRHKLIQPIQIQKKETVKREIKRHFLKTGGGGEIRTRDALTDIVALQATALDHYATPPFIINAIFNAVMASWQ